MEDSPITSSTISQNDHKETTAILRFEVPLKKGQGNNVIYFPDLINPPKETTINDQKVINVDYSSSDQLLENEMALENFVVSETADFLEHMAIEKRPEPKFYAISRKNTTPGFFGAGTNIIPPENILQFFKNEQSSNNNMSTSNIIGTIENNENKIVNKQIKPIKSRTRKNATTALKSKGKNTIKQEEKIAAVNDAVASSSASSSKKTKRQPPQQSETRTKKQKTKANEGNKTIIYKKVQRLLEKRKRRKEKKINKDVSTSSIVSSSSSKNSTPTTNSLKPVKNIEDSSSLSLSSPSSTESSPKRKGRPDVRSRSSSTSSTVTSTKAKSIPNNYNPESSGSTQMTISSDSTTTP